MAFSENVNKSFLVPNRTFLLVYNVLPWYENSSLHLPPPSFTSLLLLSTFPPSMLLKRLEKCHSELSSLTSHLQENEVYNHLNDKVTTHTDTLIYNYVTILVHV